MDRIGLFSGSAMGTVIAIMTLAACATDTVVSRSVAVSAPTENTGAIYYLPTRFIRVAAERSRLDPPCSAPASRDENGMSEEVHARCVEGLVQDAEEARAAFDAARTAVANNRQALLLEEARLRAVTDEGAADSVITTRTQSRDTARVNLALAMAAEGLAEDRYEEQVARLDAIRTDKSAQRVRMTVELLPPTADYSAGYVATPVRSAFRDDDTLINVNAQGLLSTTENTSTDRSGDIVVEVAATIASFFFGGPIGLHSFEGDGERANSEVCSGRNRFEDVVDPTNPDHLSELNTDLVDCFRHYIKVEPLSGQLASNLPEGVGFIEDDDVRATFVPTPHIQRFQPDGQNVDQTDAEEQYNTESIEILVPPPPAGGGTETESDPVDLGDDGAVDADAAGQQDTNTLEDVRRRVPTLTDARFDLETRAQEVSQMLLTHMRPPILEQEFSGYAYRTPVPYKISVIGPDNRPVQSTYALLPNTGIVGSIPVRGGALVTTRNDVEFENGMLRNWDSEQPSPAFAAVGIPARILDRLVAIITNAVQFRVNFDNQEANELAAQARLLEARVQFEAYRACIQTSETPTECNNMLPDPVVANDN